VAVANQTSESIIEGIECHIRVLAVYPSVKVGDVGIGLIYTRSGIHRFPGMKFENAVWADFVQPN
jgi:hypothetical protein